MATSVRTRDLQGARSRQAKRDVPGGAQAPAGNRADSRGTHLPGAQVRSGKASKNKFGAIQTWRCLDCGSSEVILKPGACMVCTSSKVQRFDSKAEAKRYDELRLLQKGRAIRDLECQPRFVLKVNGTKVCTYVGDFRYQDAESGKTIVEDVKSKATVTAIYRLKVKLLYALHGITVKEMSSS